jgi:hypothetical protein
MMNVEQSVEWELAEETEVLGENLPTRLSKNKKNEMKRSVPWMPFAPSGSNRNNDRR